ncbi:aegerolysin family protein [Kutzneria sp. 744]|jgi:hypothetical protein|uniref:aegerolysin family protein n=1 Tax=Kutzneria sp. (strain 744) TaxID=345341 RepID=UPI0003EEBB1E|nr:aegerolysin family protein [Kutzneria sp. 744]EWM13656.1 hypothetical protein KUTG_03960 [Kutzneria sp. 744]
MKSTHPAHRRTLPVVIWSALVATLATASLALVPAQASAARQAQQPVTPAAARSTTVALTNNVDCALVRTEARLDSGTWITEPPLVINQRGRGEWGSESNQLLRGTEGTVTYFTAGCTDPTYNYKLAKVHWKNPYFGKNDYDANGTDPLFQVSWLGLGGNSDRVAFTLDYAPPAG